MKSILIFYSIFLVFLFVACQEKSQESKIYFPDSVLDYQANPLSSTDRAYLAFSDQGAWFAYGFPSDAENFGGFSGPYLMTQENGVWSSAVLSQLHILELKSGLPLDWSTFVASNSSYHSHLEQVFENEQLKVVQKLVFSSPHTAIIQTRITNLGERKYAFQPMYAGESFLPSLHFLKAENALVISSENSSAIGHIHSWNGGFSHFVCSDSSYVMSLEAVELKPGKTLELVLSQTFVFPEYSWEDEKKNLAQQTKNVTEVLEARIKEKQKQWQVVYDKLDTSYQSNEFKNVVAKTMLTLQNNWRIPAGELKHSGLFPSYHYKWFNGFWAWDSWKHAVALAQYDTKLAKEQIRSMYIYMDEEGFIPDCIFRDTSIEKHNYRNTKPPLSAWAVWEVFKQDGDTIFLEEMYPQLKKQHQWWYKNRDHDQDGLCEYGATDGTVIAAKWESGMDNAVRFDESKILQNSETAWSLFQESVDLNAYLFAEKNYLAKIAHHLSLKKEADTYAQQSKRLQELCQQFYDAESGWFYDTSMDGKEFVKVMACEGWIPLWADMANDSQADAVKENMMKEELFNAKVPLQTLSASHPKFKPEGGYWRGPVWLDQSYFGVIGLKNYGYKREALELTNKLIYNADGVFTKGASIRENYQPITGKGLESESFSWSAAHYLLMMMEEY